MERTLKGDFHIAKLALFNARLLSALGNAEGDVKSLLRSHWERNGLDGDPVPVNQSTHMQLSYVCLVWLWESIIKNKFEQEVAIRVFEIRKLNVPEAVLGPKAKPWSSGEFLRRLRNALSHGRINMDAERYYFRDSNLKRKGDTCEFSMTWTELGALCEAVLFSVSDLLYPKAG